MSEQPDRPCRTNRNKVHIYMLHYVSWYIIQPFSGGNALQGSYRTEPPATSEAVEEIKEFPSEWSVTVVLLWTVEFTVTDVYEIFKSRT